MSDAKPYRDASLPLDERIDDLLPRMSLDEKLAQIGSVWSTELVEDGAFSRERAEEHLRHGTGHVTRIGESSNLVESPVRPGALPAPRKEPARQSLGIEQKTPVRDHRVFFETGRYVELSWLDHGPHSQEVEHGMSEVVEGAEVSSARGLGAKAKSNS